MPKFYFEATSLEGKRTSGEKEAENVSQLAKILREEGLILIRAKVKKEKKKFEISLPFFEVPLTEKMFFTRNLKVMISAGISLPKAILTLSQQVKSKKFKRALEKINQDIIKGAKFSDSLSSFPSIFNEFYQSMIKVAEETGKLEETLGILSYHLERENEIRSKIKGAMIYPAVIVLAMIGIGILMLTFVVPKLAQTFRELGVELPLTTKIVILIGEFLAQKWYLLIFGLFLFFIFISQILKTKTGKKIFDKILLSFPVFSSIVKKSNEASIARSLSSLISAGVALPKALEITANTLGNSLFREAIFQSSEKIKKGEKLSVCLKSHQKLFSLNLISMVETGEETGELSGVLKKLAEFYDEEVSNAAKNLTSVIEPILLLLIGGVVGFFAVSMVQPMYSMIQTIK